MVLPYVKSFIVWVTSGIKWWFLRRYFSLRAWLGLDTLPPLREFVYIDNQALISLLASTTGGITEQKTTGQKERISSSITGGVGPISATVGGNSEEYSEQTSRFVIQSNFKEFYEMRKDDIISSADSEEGPPDFLIGSDVTASEVDAIQPDSRVEQYDRGSLVELEVLLGSAEVFDYYRVIQAFEEIVESFTSNEELQQQLQQEGVTSDTVRIFNELIDLLLAGLIPIQGELVNYGVLDNQENVLIRKELAQSLDLEYHECHATGFISEDNLWQDPTRVLFDNSQFTIFSRVDDPELSKEWTPMKLVSVVNTVFSDADQNIEDFPELFKSADRERLRSQDGIIGTTADDDIGRYLDMVEEDNGNIENKGQILDQVSSEVDISSTNTIEYRKQCLEEIDRHLSESVDGYEDWSVSDARHEDFFERQWENQDYQDEQGENSDNIDSEIHYLETSFIAIYW
ncbi:DUF6414 family protein [Halomicrobium salinisoli]|uniref:DUF6414 family protein n=1 Tax=Halomicrobium salinisoli TaxID=2878391 RepID=UPI001CF01C6B|nr:hypothetical protein [Halomicrobium salinisoli]